VRDAVRVTDGVFNRHGASLRHTEQRESLEACRFHDCLKVLHPRFQGNFSLAAIGEAAASLVIADQLMGLRKLLDPMAPYQRFQLILDTKPVRGFDQWRTFAHSRVGEPRTVGGRAVPDFLM
jgi:hypothetical protein